MKKWDESHQLRFFEEEEEDEDEEQQLLLLPEFQYNETGYNDDVKLTQLIIHIIGFYALKDTVLDAKSEKSVGLALQFIDDYPVEMFLKEIYNAQELFSQELGSKLDFLYEDQIQEDIDVQKLNDQNF